MLQELPSKGPLFEIFDEAHGDEIVEGRAPVTRSHQGRRWISWDLFRISSFDPLCFANVIKIMSQPEREPS